MGSANRTADTVQQAESRKLAKGTPGEGCGDAIEGATAATRLGEVLLGRLVAGAHRRRNQDAHGEREALLDRRQELPAGLAVELR
jgi:hypothetical protein